MYDLIDRKVASLQPAEQFLLYAMRGWAHAQAMGAEPVRGIARLFAGHGLAHALDPFDALMGSLNDALVDDLALGRPCHARVAEDEAVMLSVWRTIATRGIGGAVPTLALLVGEPAARPIAAAMATMVEALDGRIALPGAR